MAKSVIESLLPSLSSSENALSLLGCAYEVSSLQLPDIQDDA